MDRRTRICIWIIAVGLVNFLLYGISYAWFYGEAIHGWTEVVDGQRIYHLQSGRTVSREVFIASGIHSISIWPTVAAIMLAMLTLAKERISSSMRRAVVRGRALITVLAVVVALGTGLLTWRFTQRFVHQFEVSAPPQATQKTDVDRQGT
ncbi:MAG: hypothetical protein KGY99_08040 [Phycisphaerae bacterium]|nr:hypothetical protein [Phycisphaerae bacterium]